MAAQSSPAHQIHICNPSDDEENTFQKYFKQHKECSTHWLLPTRTKAQDRSIVVR